MLWKLYGIKGDTLMKKFDLKDNKRFTSVLAMILATCVVIGLLSSTAIKLASATLLMKSSIKSTNIPIVDKFIEDVLDIPVVPSPAPSTPSTPVSPVTPNTTKPTEAPTTQAPTTQAPAETEKEETTKAPETQAPTTQAPTTQAPTETQAPETEAGQSVAEKQSILKSYKDVVARGKLKDSQPGFTKVTYRSLEWDFLGNIFYEDVAGNNADYFISEDAAKAAPVVVPAKTASNLLCIENDSFACLLNEKSEAAVSEAIKSASKEELKDGTFKIVITLNDEENPTPIKTTDKKANSFTSAMFPVVTGEQFRIGMDKNGVESVNLKYTDCSVELIYKPATGEIVSLKQVTKYVADVENGYIPAKGTVTEVSEYSNFVY